MKKKFKILLIILLSIAIISLSFFFMENYIFDPHRGVVTNFENSAPLSQNLSKKEALEDMIKKGYSKATDWHNTRSGLDKALKNKKLFLNFEWEYINE